jgi:hypothetical protein
MLVNNNESLLWVILEDGGVVSGGSYFKYYCHYMFPEGIRLGDEDQEVENRVVKKEDTVKDIFYSS